MISRENKQTNNKITGLFLYILIITLNANSLKTPIKREIRSWRLGSSVVECLLSMHSCLAIFRIDS
jgi:hypothetical protein